MGRISKLLFGISPRETLVETRGFTVTDSHVKQRIEQIGSSFVAGYHAALLEDNLDKLQIQLDESPQEQLGFVYEGAAMALVIIDTIKPWQASHWQAFLLGPGANHDYMLHVGAGWALARLPVSMAAFLKNKHPLLRWLVLDGYGFHQGYFNPQRFIRQQNYPKKLSGYGFKAFDQGLGRSLWFVDGANPDKIAATIQAFPLSRQAELWSGVGLACAYAGGVDQASLQQLLNNSGRYHLQLAQGVAFAAKARQKAGNSAAHTELASQVMCKRSLIQAAELTDQALINLPEDQADETAYETWRQRIVCALSH